MARVMADETKIWLDVLQIIIPALLIVGGGSVGWWKYLQEQERQKVISEAKRKKEEQERQKDLSDYRLQADKAAWERVKSTISIQADRINAQDKKILALEQQVEDYHSEAKKSAECVRKLEVMFGDCEKQVKLLEDRNEKLERENYTLKGLLKEK